MRRAAGVRRLVAGAMAVVGVAACAGGVAPGRVPAPITPTTAFGFAVDSLLADPKWSTAQWGVLVVDPTTGDTLYSRNAGKLFLPASNEKIITGAVALARLGPEYRWRTVLAVRGGASVHAREGTLPGDLFVIGSGDPTVSDAMQRGGALAPLRGLADSLWARGVRRITGDVVARADGGSGVFPEGPWKFGWEWDDLDTPSGAGVTELLFNEGVARVTVIGGAQAGAPVRVVVQPTARALPLVVSPSMHTVAAGAPTQPPEAAWDYDTSHYVLRGTMTVGDSAVIELGIHDPRRAYAGALRDALEARGIAVGGTAVEPVRVSGDSITCSDGRCEPAVPRVSLDTLAVLTSPPLGDVLPAMEKPSQNQIAEALFLTLGREGTGVGSGDSARRVVGEQLRAWGVEPEHAAVVRDGSGLSRHDYVTPTALVRVLDAVRRLPTFRLFYDALPVAGVDGTLGTRLRGTLAAGRVHAKTGSIDRARSLSGYATTAAGRFLIFSLLCNNYTVPTPEVTRVQDAIVLRMAALGAH